MNKESEIKLMREWNLFIRKKLGDAEYRKMFLEFYKQEEEHLFAEKRKADEK